MSIDYGSLQTVDTPESLSVGASMNLDRRLTDQALQHPHLLLITILFGLLGGICFVLRAYVLSQVVNNVFLEDQRLDQVSQLLGIFFGLACLRSLLIWVSKTSGHRLAIEIKDDMSDRLVKHILKLGPAYTHGERSGELVAVISEGVEALDAYFSEYLPAVALAALIPITFLLFIFPLDLMTAVILLLTAPLIPFFMILIGSTTIRRAKEQWNELRRMGAQLLDSIQGITTLKILGRSKDQVKVIARLSEDFRDRTMGVLRIAFLSALVLEIVATISVAVVAVEIGLRLLSGKLAFDQGLFILLLAPEFYLPLRTLGARFHSGAAGTAAANRIFDILEYPIPQRAAGRAKPTFRPPVIRFQEVHYWYEEGGSPVVGDLSFSIQPEKTTALVGPSGSGKSTIASLLLGFISPSKGKIWIDDLLLDDLDPTKWRSMIAWVPQSPYLFNGTILENILLARPEASMHEVQEAASLAHVDEFIHKLPKSYETWIGERGIRLSSGQGQRIALARAFLKDAPILILDEGTADLDPEIETHIQGAITNLKKNRTTLMIAHRLGTVMDADQILVIKDGHIIETGNHDELLKEEGLYARMITAYRGMARPRSGRRVKST